jgi:hypothetical protein
MLAHSAPRLLVLQQTRHVFSSMNGLGASSITCRKKKKKEMNFLRHYYFRR